MAKNTIKLKKYTDIQNEYAAGGAITPGMFVVLGSAGTVTAGIPTVPMIALEDEYQGKTIDDAFASGNPVPCWVTTRGEEAYGILAAGEDVAKGDKLEVDATGKLVALASGVAVAIALDTLDLSASGAVDGRIAVRIM